VAQPRFSWRLESADPVRGLKQSAWQMAVEQAGGELLWDSGKMASDESVNRTYAGKTLKSNQDCRWKVRVWDQTGRAGPWSESARFVMGLLRPDDWQGDWIRYREAQDIEHIWYRKGFELDKIPDGIRCRWTIAAG
jgi:alpha-L-rhamnosidase